MSQTEFDAADTGGEPTDSNAIPEAVDWLLGGLIALGGLLLLFAGTVLTTVVGRDELVEAIDEGDTLTVGSTELTRAEAIDVSEAVVSWVGVGLLVTGGALVLFALAYVFVRRRDTRRSERGEATSSYYANAVRGSVVTVFFSFVGFSAVLGGGLAGYLEGGDSDQSVSVGGVAGLLSALPALVIAVFTLIGLFAGLRDIGQTGPLAVAAIGMALAVLIYTGINATLGALGGYVGGRLAE
jgi:hypothetical protein